MYAWNSYDGDSEIMNVLARHTVLLILLLLTKSRSAINLFWS